MRKLNEMDYREGVQFLMRHYFRRESVDSIRQTRKKRLIHVVQRIAYEKYGAMFVDDLRMEEYMEIIFEVLDEGVKDKIREHKIDKILN